MAFGFRDIMLAAALGALVAALSFQPDLEEETFYGTLVELDGAPMDASGSAVTLSVIDSRTSGSFYRVHIDCWDVGFQGSHDAAKHQKGRWFSDFRRRKRRANEFCPAKDPARLERIVDVMTVGGDIVVSPGDSATMTSEVGRAKFAIRYRPIE